MVTFRFYVVTTVALFLALAIGIVVGSALDERLVDTLESQVARVQGNLDDTAESIDAKNREIDELQQYLEASAPFATEGRLPDTTVVVVAEEGIDGEPAEELVRQARMAGAHAEGIVWLHPRWHLADVADRQELSAAMKLDGGSAVTIRGAAWTSLLSGMAEVTGAALVPDGGSADTTAAPTDPTLDPPTTIEPTTTVPTTTTTTTVGTDGDASTTADTTADPIDIFGALPMSSLEDLGFVRLQRIDGDGPASGTNLVVVFATGQDSDFETSAGLLGELSQMTTERGIPTVIAEIYRPAKQDEDHERGSTLEEWRGGDPGDLSTVDDLDLLAGRVATILALADLRQGISGHYGYGAGADRVLPEWSGP